MPIAKCNLIVVGVILSPLFVHADVYISEFMFDLSEGSDSGREWIEVFNAGNESVDLTEWKLFEANTNHSIASSVGGNTLVSGGYAIIADNPGKFLLDWPGFSGIVFDSAFSLSNSGEELEMRNSNLVGSGIVSYTNTGGGAGDGNTLHRSSSSNATYTSGAPTPGNGVLVVDGSNTQAIAADSGADNTSPDPNVKTVVSSYVAPIVPEVFAYAGKDRDVVAGAEVVFDGKAYDRDGKALTDSKARFMWAFGDGSTAEGAKVAHTFYEPGKYAVVLNISEALNTAAHRVIVNAHPVSVVVMNTDGKITLINKSGRDIDLSRWFLRSMNATFNIPENTILLSGASVVFPQEITKLVAADDAALLYPSGVAAARVGEVTVPAVITVPSSQAQDSVGSSLDELQEISKEAVEKGGDGASAVVEAVGQVASVSASDENTAMWWLGAVGIGVIGGGAALAVRRIGRKEWDIVDENE